MPATAILTGLFCACASLKINPLTKSNKKPKYIRITFKFYHFLSSENFPNHNSHTDRNIQRVFHPDLWYFYATIRQLQGLITYPMHFVAKNQSKGLLSFLLEFRE